MTIDEQIEYTQSIVATSLLPTHMPKAILASLERLKAIDSVQVPDEPDVKDYVEAGGYYEARDNYIDTLRDLLKQCKHNSGVTMDELGEMRERAEAAEAKLSAIEKMGREPSEGMKIMAGDLGDGYQLNSEQVLMLFTPLFAKMMEELK